jgi:hypothetical protein
VRRIPEPLRRPRLEEYDDTAVGSFQVGHPVRWPSLSVPGSVTRSGMSVGDGNDYSAGPGVPEMGRRGKVASWSRSGHVGETG